MSDIFAMRENIKKYRYTKDWRRIAMVVEPIKPSDINEAKAGRIPPEIIKVFNELIAKHYSYGSATVKQEDAMILTLAQNLQWTRGEIYENNWFDIEPVFRAAGWDVTYDKPAYYESYGAYFTFTKKGD